MTHPNEYGIAEQDIAGIVQAKRLGLQWAPFCGDWFVSYSPRNGNSHAEGPWDHWVSLAVSILQHPMTAVVRPEAHAVARALPNIQFYNETNRPLSDDELEDLIEVE